MDPAKIPPSERIVVQETCPPRRIHSLLTPKWSSMVMYVLSYGPSRTGQLQRSMPGVSKKMLTQSLRDLESEGLINRKVFEVVPPMVEYSLTDLGQSFVEPLLALYRWAEDNSALLDKLEQNRKAAAVPQEDAD
ncbi:MULTISPECIES: winged helix-turn-helix transcriptional regulator [unclassified Pseudomonas]|uniref:winged helix-turn-helix transcriptional regulator n=1 Tax=unclassified Pseudomonas TaxID=196821 RepID=UPI0035C22FE5